MAQLTLSGNADAAMPFIVEANANRQPVYVLGYSAGGNDAHELVNKCKTAGIPIAGLFMLDPGAFGYFTGKIPDNVRRVFFLMSAGASLPLTPGEYPEDPRKTSVKVETMAEFHHLELPAHAARNIRDDITGR